MARRQAARSSLDMRVRTEAARILGVRQVDPQRTDLDTRRIERTKLIVMKSAIDRQVIQAVGRSTGERSEFAREQLDTIDSRFADLVSAAEPEVFGA